MQHRRAVNANGKYLFFERNRSLPQKSITSKFNTIKHGGFDKCSSFSKRLALKKYSLSFPSCKKIKKYLPVWKMLTADQSVLYSVNEGNIPPPNPNIRGRIKRKLKTWK